MEIDCIREQSLNDLENSDVGESRVSNVEQTHDPIKVVDGLLDSKLSMNS